VNTAIRSTSDADAELLRALVALVTDARNAELQPTTAAVEAWMRSGDRRAMIDRLESDPAIARTVATGMIMRVPPYLGRPVDLWLWLLGFLRDALRPGVDVAAEARNFLRFARVDDGVVPARARAILLGLTVEEPIALPFGRLLPATARDVALLGEIDRPPAVVFESDIDLCAGLTNDPNDMIWTVERGEELEAEMYDRLDEAALGRLLITLVFCHPAGPIQEHAIAFAARYDESFVARDPAPLGPVWASRLMRRSKPAIDIDDLRRVAEIVARLSSPRRIVVATRRYFQAGAERHRPADALVDYATAIEALAGVSNGKKQAEWIVSLLSPHPFWTGRISHDFEELRHARNGILHHGVIPPDARVRVGMTRTLVEHTIRATVRRDLGIAVAPTPD
jgi:hypothetical protein